jgi:hypothetical protein
MKPLRSKDLTDFSRAVGRLRLRLRPLFTKSTLIADSY